MENEKYRFKINWKKWKAAVDEVLDRRTKKRSTTEKKYWSADDYNFDKELTKLYSIRAHARGRVHRKKARLEEYKWRKLGHNEPDSKAFIDANGMIVFDLTIEDQAKYIGDEWKQYEQGYVPEEKQVVKAKVPMPQQNKWWELWK